MRSFLALTMSAALLSPCVARAQTVDMASLRCDDLGRLYLDQFVFIDAWFSGFFHAKSNKTTVDLRQVAANTQKVLQFCKANPTVTVLQAIERLSAAGG